jgi:enoyl-CoA hydratase/carnithine racemase
MSTLASGATVLVREDGPAVRVTLNRPDKRNALSYELMEELIGALRSVGDARAVVIEANGPAFSAGHDLSEMIDRDVPFFQRLFERCTELMELIHKLPQPVIAKVHGPAAAAGCQLVAQCDLAIAAEGTKFVTSGVNWGFFCSTPGVAVGRNLQRKHAMEMLLTGEPISAQRALEWGLVNRVVAPEKLDEEVLKLAQNLAAKPPATVAAGKRAFYQQMDLGLEQAYKLASGVIAASFAHEEGRAGMDAFIEKRPPPKH